MSDVPAAASNGASQEELPKITLHWLETSRAQRILWLLEELDLPYTLKVYKRGSDMLAPAELKKVHPLGKSPLVTIETPSNPTPRVIAESGAIVEFLCEHFGTRNGQHMVPQQWREGMEGKIDGETDEWTRYRYYMHYAEGTFMPTLVLQLIINLIKEAKGAPFFIRPVTRAIGARFEDAFLTRNLVAQFTFLESQMPAGDGMFWAGPRLTGADSQMIYPLQAARGRAGMTKDKYPKLWAYVDRIQERPAYKRAVQKVIDEVGEFKSEL